jgi:hypothetical protein
MIFEQVERHRVDQLRLPLESSEHLGREPGRRVPLTRDPLRMLPPASNKSARSGTCLPVSGCRDPDEVIETTNGREQYVQ